MDELFILQVHFYFLPFYYIAYFLTIIDIVYCYIELSFSCFYTESFSPTKPCLWD